MNHIDKLLAQKDQLLLKRKELKKFIEELGGTNENGFYDDPKIIQKKGNELEISGRIIGLEDSIKRLQNVITTNYNLITHNNT